MKQTHAILTWQRLSLDPYWNATRRRKQKHLRHMRMHMRVHMRIYSNTDPALIFLAWQRMSLKCLISQATPN